MRPPTPRPLLLCFSSLSVLRPASLFSTSSSSSHHSPSTWKQWHDEESKAVKVTVWWDFENCSIPNGISPYCVSHRITMALRSQGIKGPVTITAFGNVLQLSHATQDALCTTGVCLNHVPNCGKNSTDRSILVDLVHWVAQNPPPAHFFLISGDRDFASILHRLRMSNYNILIASSDHVSSALFSAATIMWHWNELVRGEEVTGKHFNHPPDGSYGSWYGHRKGALDDPFLDADETALSQPVDYVKAVAESKPRPIPKALVNKISQILASKPKGINICDLHNELRKSGSYFDKDYFGHKKLSCLVSSLSNIATVKPHPAGESDLVAYSARGKSKESVQPSLKPALDEVVDSGDKDHSGTGEESVKDTGGSSLGSPPQAVNRFPTKDRKLDSHTTVTGDTDMSTLKDNSSKASKRNINAHTSLCCNVSLQDTPTGDAGTFTPLKDDNSDATDKKIGVVGPEQNKEGIFRRIWRSLGSLFQPSGKKDKYENSDRLSVADDSRSKKMKKTLTKGENVRPFESHSEHLSSASVDKITGTQSSGHKVHCENTGNSNLSTETHYLFSQDHFWDSLETFLCSPKGSEIVSKALSRKHLIMRLQEEGPLVLHPLTDHHISQLIDLLISKKTWVEHCSSERFPFRVVLPVKRSCVPSHVRGSDGLSHIFSSRGSQSISCMTQGLEGPDQNLSSENLDSIPPRDLVELKAWYHKTFDGNGNIEVDEFKKHFENKYGRMLDAYFYGYCTIESLLAACSIHNASNQEGKKSSQRSRNEILSDCQKLVNEALEENPAGLFLSTFKSMFTGRYGYDLDYRRLGYTKLADMLNTLPGVKIKFDLILPDRNSHPNCATGKTVISELLNCYPGAGKGKSADVEDNPWAELGPVTKKAMLENSKPKKEEQVHFEIVTLSDEESSDPENSTSIDSDVFKLEGNQRKSNEKSSLLQILESWDNSKMGGSKNQLLVNSGLVDCSRSESIVPASLLHSDSSTSLRSKSSKKYNFVTDSGGSKGAETSGVLHQ